MLRRDGGALPNLIVIGAAKSGTSALHYYLQLHPQIAMSQPKELNFFVADVRVDLLGRGGAAADPRWFAARNWSRGPAWYASHFPPGAAVRGESSPAYTLPWYPGAAERMASVVPGAKLVFIVRDPIERAVSHYLQWRTQGRERRPPQEALADVDGPYVTASRYLTALEPYLMRYPTSRILVTSAEDLLERRRQTLRAVYRFLEVGETFWSPKIERRRNVTARVPRHGQVLRRRLGRMRLLAPAYRLPDEMKWWIDRALFEPGGGGERPVLAEPLRRRLATVLRDETDRLRELTGQPFAGWSV